MLVHVVPEGDDVLQVLHGDGRQHELAHGARGQPVAIALSVSRTKECAVFRERLNYYVGRWEIRLGRFSPMHKPLLGLCAIPPDHEEEGLLAGGTCG